VKTKTKTALEQLQDRLNEVPEDLRQGPVIFAAAALIGPFILVLLATLAGPSVSSPLLTLAAIVFVVAVSGFAWTTYRHFRAQQAENLRREAARAHRRADRRRSVSQASRTGPASETGAANQRHAS
jgi:cytochrome c-type biogenesis protein CcmH/NrfG